jgi:hypothetical protein
MNKQAKPFSRVRRRLLAASSAPIGRLEWLVPLLLAAAATIGLGDRAIAQTVDDGFQPIFDGRTLEGWETPDESYWTVEDGAITGRITAEHPCTINQYLVWTGGELADFELKHRSRVNGEGGINNGFQYRSRVLPDHDVCGYQVDNNLETPWLVRLYDEFGRHTLAMRGERATFDAAGGRTVETIDEAAGPAWFRLEDWHEYHLVCVENRITLSIDGRLAAEVVDGDARRAEPQGALALQLHSGPPTVVQFKDIQLKILKAAEPVSQVNAADQDEKRQAVRRDAVAWWSLDTGGHGATPPLRHIPGWEQFELNVRAAGPGARAGRSVVVLDGAYFDAGPHLHGGTDGVTVYLRVRDPAGAWNAALMGKGAGDEVEFYLFSADLPETSGPDVAFQVATEQGIATVSFPVSQIDAAAWHNLVGRYDGATLAIYCDGQRMASVPCSGPFKQNKRSLLIGAELDGETPARQIRGEVEEAAIWSRALSASEIEGL